MASHVLLRRPLPRAIRSDSSMSSDDFELVEDETNEKHSKNTSSTDINTFPPELTGHCNPSPEFLKEDEDVSEVITGPDPFPFRPPREDKINQLYEYYEKYLISDKKKEGEEFRLEDFLLTSDRYGLDGAVKIDSRVISSQNYELSYQRNYTSNRRYADEIRQILSTELLNTVDLNKIVEIDLVPRRIPVFQQKLNHMNQANVERIENIQKIIAKKENYQIPVIDSKNGNREFNSKTPLPPLAPKDGHYETVKRQKSEGAGLGPMDSFEIERRLNSQPSSETRQGTISVEVKSTEKLELGRQSFVREVLTPIIPARDVMELLSESDDDTPPLSALELAMYDSLAESGGLTLSLRGWFLTNLPPLQPLNKTLVYLNLSFNCLKEVPTFVFTCSNLQVLKLRNNPITNIPKKISSLTRLRILIVSFCKIKSLPESLFRLPSIIFMDLSYNYLSELPTSIGYCNTLNFLNLSGNELRGMPHNTISMIFHKIKLKNNFMQRAFWKDAQFSSPCSLKSLCLQVISKSSKVQPTTKVDLQLKETEFTCAICKTIAIGQSYSILRPCSGIWGKKVVPFIFKCCSWQCGKSAKVVKSQAELLNIQ